MKTKTVSFLALLLLSISCLGIPLDTPTKKPPRLTAEDLAWADGKVFAKGLLPDLDGFRISSIKLEFEDAEGKRRQVGKELYIEHWSDRPPHWQGISGELLIVLEEKEDLTSVFIGAATPRKNTWSRTVEDFGPSALPGYSYTFEGRTGDTTTDLDFVVPIGESEIFRFFDGTERYGSLFVIAKGMKKQGEPNDADNQ